MDAYMNKDYPFERLFEIMNIPRDNSRSRIFQVGFSMKTYEEAETPSMISIQDYEGRDLKFSGLKPKKNCF